MQILCQPKTFVDFSVDSPGCSGRMPTVASSSHALIAITRSLTNLSLSRCCATRIPACYIVSDMARVLVNTTQKEHINMSKKLKQNTLETEVIRSGEELLKLAESGQLEYSSELEIVSMLSECEKIASGLWKRRNEELAMKAALR